MPSAATAAKKEEKAAANAGPKLTLSKEFMPGAQAIQKLVQAQDWAGAKAKIPELEPLATKADDKYFLGQMILNIGLQLKEQPLQRKALEMMLASGLTPAADVGKFNFFVGQFAFVGKEYPSARASLDTAIKAGYDDPQALVLLANTYFLEAQGQISGNAFTPAGQTLIRQGLPFLKQAITAQQAKGAAADASWYNTGFRMAIASKDPSLPEWTKWALTNAGTGENWRLALREIQNNNETMTRDENLDLLRLMASSKSLQNAYSYSEYAETAWKAGLPGEVKSIIDTGRQSGEINATQLTDLYQLANGSIAKDKASLPASEKAAAAAPTGKPAGSAGNAFLSYGDYAKAAELYREALQKGGVDANEINTRLGIALARSGDKAGALDAFGKVTGTGVRKQIADLWIVWVNKQTA
ncbi:tetratricopeptide repeat protein [Sphingobium nicotianae]|nr:tetratricopeptide repeat protein [Sphingobium nicotianae]